MNSCSEGGFREQAERPESVTVFRHLLCRPPDIVAGEIDVFPAKGGQMSQQVVGDMFSLTQDGDGAFKYRVFQRMIAVTRKFRPEARCCWFS